MKIRGHLSSGRDQLDDGRAGFEIVDDPRYDRRGFRDVRMVKGIRRFPVQIAINREIIIPHPVLFRLGGRNDQIAIKGSVILAGEFVFAMVRLKTPLPNNIEPVGFQPPIIRYVVDGERGLVLSAWIVPLVVCN